MPLFVGVYVIPLGRGLLRRRFFLARNDGLQAHVCLSARFLPEVAICLDHRFFAGEKVAERRSWNPILSILGDFVKSAELTAVAKSFQLREAKRTEYLASDSDVKRLFLHARGPRSNKSKTELLFVRS